MPRISRSSLVTYSVEQMYDLVSDIESYPEFLPGCAGGTILKQDGDWVEASLALAKGGMQQVFTTRNRMLQNQSIEMHLLKGPFKHLSGIWTFEALGEGSKVHFELDFEMKNKLTQLTMGPMFGKVMNKMVDAFAQRAKQIYG